MNDPSDRVVLVYDSWLTDRVSYNPVRKELKIHFLQTDTTWIYYEIPHEIVAHMVFAESVGDVFNHHIRGEYETERLDNA